MQVSGGCDDDRRVTTQIDLRDAEVVQARVSLQLDDARDGHIAPVAADLAYVFDLQPRQGQAMAHVADGHVAVDKLAPPADGPLPRRAYRKQRTGAYDRRGG